MTLDSGYVYCGFEFMVCEVDENDWLFSEEKNNKL